MIGEEDDDNISRKSDDVQYFEGFLFMKCGRYKLIGKGPLLICNFQNIGVVKAWFTMCSYGVSAGKIYLIS